MRLWSLHPQYLDAKGLVALWREGLLAQKVLAGQTKGYRNHPQLIRFRGQLNPQESIGAYLSGVVLEAERRGYNFQRDKISCPRFSGAMKHLSIPVSSGQIEYERLHLITKLQKRDRRKLAELEGLDVWLPHPLFSIVEGPVEVWEKT
ncbi:MAG: DNA lyase [Spirochaetales bacterium]|nr:MAG: DNA lyase [Spirochaetales bacterium]